MEAKTMGIACTGVSGVPISDAVEPFEDLRQYPYYPMLNVGNDLCVNRRAVNTSGLIDFVMRHSRANLQATPNQPSCL